ncbi:sensor histidine kinase [Marinilabilia sp.]
MLKTILRNLISNAIKLTHPQGQIHIRTEKNVKNITVIISDNGIGIKEEVIPTLWDFTKLNSTPGTQGEKGTGFGLLICKGLVEKHGGEIWVESEHGRGTDFKFTLPIT